MIVNDARKLIRALPINTSPGERRCFPPRIGGPAPPEPSIWQNFAGNDLSYYTKGRPVWQYFYENLDIVKAEQYTVGQWMDVWFENCAKIEVRPSSHQTHREYIDNHIKPNIGDVSLSKLSSLHLQKLYKKLLTGGRVERTESKKRPKGLSAKTVRNIDQVISSAMDFAKDQKLICSDPADGCALPKLEHKEMKTLPVEQLTSFLREAQESGVSEMYYIELATGLRRGELSGLKWEDINLEQGSLRVQRQVCRIDGEIVEASLKTRNACQDGEIPMITLWRRIPFLS